MGERIFGLEWIYLRRANNLSILHLDFYHITSRKINSGRSVINYVSNHQISLIKRYDNVWDDYFLEVEDVIVKRFRLAIHDKSDLILRGEITDEITDTEFIRIILIVTSMTSKLKFRLKNQEKMP